VNRPKKTAPTSQTTRIAQKIPHCNLCVLIIASFCQEKDRIGRADDKQKPTANRPDELPATITPTTPCGLVDEKLQYYQLILIEAQVDSQGKTSPGLGKWVAVGAIMGLNSATKWFSACCHASLWLIPIFGRRLDQACLSPACCVRGGKKDMLRQGLSRETVIVRRSSVRQGGGEYQPGGGHRQIRVGRVTVWGMGIPVA